MTFKEFSHAIRTDAKLMELLNRCDRSADALSDEELDELVARCDKVCKREGEEWE